MTHQHVLLSGASDGAVRCWQLNPQSSNFECSSPGGKGGAKSGRFFGTPHVCDGGCC